MRKIALANLAYSAVGPAPYAPVNLAHRGQIAARAVAPVNLAQRGHIRNSLGKPEIAWDP